MKKLKRTCPSQLAPADVILTLMISSDIVKFLAEVTVGQATNALWQWFPTFLNAFLP